MNKENAVIIHFLSSSIYPHSGIEAKAQKLNLLYRYVYSGQCMSRWGIFYNKRVQAMNNFRQ